jgi:hypothetical protein
LDFSTIFSKDGAILNVISQSISLILQSLISRTLERERERRRRRRRRKRREKVDLEGYSQEEAIFYSNLILDVVISMEPLCLIPILAF